ncbi:hypothetical protein EX30DRAFT_361089 [Ascodesmis nigricans]|uniref:Clr5 domain-containing protein n=1 Tax=Ascodesmis nigricans TaxID=341454 RepID=A0A4S2N784_9PEZI|nr:hypothetical protein EX30DRAFT_361089 [Ascodesmis nigricans]
MTKNWDLHKEQMYDLYMRRGMRLVELQAIMAQHYNFQASERAYKQKFKEWQWFKKTPRNSSRLELDYSDNDRYSDDGRASATSHYGSEFETGASTSAGYSEAILTSTSPYLDRPMSMPQYHYSLPPSTQSYHTAHSFAVPSMGGHDFGVSMGGVPQRNSLQEHKQAFKLAMSEADIGMFSGCATIPSHKWRNNTFQRRKRLSVKRVVGGYQSVHLEMEYQMEDKREGH